MLATKCEVCSPSESAIETSNCEEGLKHDDEQASSGFSESLDSHDDIADLGFGADYECFGDVTSHLSNSLRYENGCSISEQHDCKSTKMISYLEQIASNKYDGKLSGIITDVLQIAKIPKVTTSTANDDKAIGSLCGDDDLCSMPNNSDSLPTTTKEKKRESTLLKHDDEEFLFSDCMSCSTAMNFNLSFSSESLSTISPTYRDGHSQYVEIDNFDGSRTITPGDILSAEAAIFNILPSTMCKSDVVSSRRASNCIFMHISDSSENLRMEEDNANDDNINFDGRENAAITANDRTRSCLVDYRSNKTSGCQASRVVKFADEMGYALDSIRYLTPPNDYLSPIMLMDAVSDKVESLFRQVRPRRMLVSMFEQPNSTMNFEEMLDHRIVLLEYTFSNCMAIYGSVRVKNIAFEKQVLIRYTMDEWMTSRNLKATYSHHHDDNDSDSFSFYCNFSMWSTSLKRIDFAAQFISNDEEHWDNNEGKNYTLLCKYA